MKEKLNKLFPNFINWKKVFTFNEKGVILLVLLFAVVGVILGLLA